MRQPLNSDVLRAKNKTLYRSFFSNYDFVVSSPGGAILAGTFTDHVGGPGLHQKVPLRNYLGVKIIEKNDIIFENYGTYDYFTNSFIILDVKKENIGKLRLLREMISLKLGREIGLSVGILNEIPRRTGLNNPGTNAANLTAAYLLLTEQITARDLDDFQNLTVDFDSKKRNLIKATAKKFHSVWLNRKSAGFGVLSSLVNRSDILVYNPAADYPVVPIAEIFSQESFQELPFDVVIIGTSDRYDIDFSLRKYDEVGNIFSITNEDVTKFDKGFGLDEPEIDDFPAALCKSYFDVASTTGLATVIAVGKFIKDPSIENQRICLQLFNSSYDMINLFGQNFSRKNKVHSFVKKYYYEVLSDMPFAITTGITNNLALVTPKESSRQDLSALVGYLERKLGFDISYPYISWIDDSDNKGAVVEKWDDQGIQAAYIQRNCLNLYSVHTMDVIPMVTAIDNREGLEKTYDILFDEDDKKIFINGKKVTSKELPTVAATLSLFNLLTQTEDFEISSEKLPDQSYFQDRNELQSKIVSPLRIYVEKELNKHINLKISGTLSEYKVTLFPSDISVGVIRRC